MLETLAKVFVRVRESNIFFRESFASVRYNNTLGKGLPPTITHCRPGSGRRRALENFGLVLVQFPVWWCLWTITPFIGSSRASKGEASRQPNAMVLKHILAPAAVTALMMLFEVSRNKLLMTLFLQCTPCWWPGSVNRDIFAKVPRKLCERAGESQSACWRGWASKPCQKKPSQQQYLPLEGIPWC